MGTDFSHPEFAQQYGNIGTINPYADARPGTAVVKKVEDAPVSGNPLDPSQLVGNDRWFIILCFYLIFFE